MLDKKTFGIGILALTAVILLVANFFAYRSAEAAAVIKDRDFQAVTVRSTGGGEALYVADTRTGMIAVFVYDPGTRGLRLRATRPVSDAFRQP
jgi:hypothetical protein